MYTDWPSGRAWIIKQALNDHFGEIDNDRGAEAKKKALNKIQMCIRDNPAVMFNKLWGQYSIYCQHPKLNIDDNEIWLEIKTKVPTKIYGDAILIAENVYKIRKGDRMAQILPRLLMEEISTKYKDLQKGKN